MNIQELADAAGLTRRAVRFYVQQKLIPPPHGLGRGGHYDGGHLEQLMRVRQLQQAGHSLEQVRHILGGGGVSGLAAAGEGEGEVFASHKAQHESHKEDGENDSRPLFSSRVVPAFRAELWRRLRVLDGVELSFDAARFNPSIEDLMALREAAARVFYGNDREDNETEKETP